MRFTRQFASFIVCCAFLGSPAGHINAETVPDAGEIIKYTNDNRQSAGLDPVTKNDILMNAAEQKAQDMAIKEYFSHTGPRGEEPWVWAENLGYQFRTAGENIALNYVTAFDCVAGWMNSPGHRTNILKPDYNEIGIGVAEGKYQGRDAVFIVQLFGLAANPSPSPAPSPLPQITQYQAPTPEPFISPAPAEMPKTNPAYFKKTRLWRKLNPFIDKLLILNHRLGQNFA